MNIRATIRTGLVLGVLLALAGCSPDWKLEIDSNTHWYAQYGGVSGDQWSESSIEGDGSRTIGLGDNEAVCARVEQAGDGYVRIKLKDEGGGWFHIFAADSREAETNHDGGTAEACSQGSIPSSY